jgi:proteasome lid subunit RPN8/RPN11
VPPWLSPVERLAVNQSVKGSNPFGGATISKKAPFSGLFMLCRFGTEKCIFGKKPYLSATLNSLMSGKLSVSIPRNLLDTILAGAKQLYPRESFLMLRGKKHKDTVIIKDLLLAPFAAHGRGFASYPTHMLPMDFSIIGTVHSHPSGNIQPSSVDLNHVFGRILMIVGYPFVDERCVAVYSSDGEKLTLNVIPSVEDAESEF